MHAEHLHPPGLAGRFAAETIAARVDHRAAACHRSASRHCRVDRVAGRRHHDQVAGGLCGSPVLAGIVGAEQRAMRLLVAAEAMHGSDQVGEIAEIARRLEVPARHQRRKAQHLGLLVIARAQDPAADEGGQPLDQRAAPIQAIDTGLHQQALLEPLVEQGGGGRLGQCLVGLHQPITDLFTSDGNRWFSRPKAWSRPPACLPRAPRA